MCSEFDLLWYVLDKNAHIISCEIHFFSMIFINFNHFFFRSRSVGRRSRLRTRQVRKYKKVKPNVEVTDQTLTSSSSKGHINNQITCSPPNHVTSAALCTPHSGSHSETSVPKGQTPNDLGPADPDTVCCG